MNPYSGQARRGITKHPTLRHPQNPQNPVLKVLRVTEVGAFPRMDG